MLGLREYRFRDLRIEMDRDAHRFASHQQLPMTSPVGLRLGGEGPDAIALAIAAELQQEFESLR